MALTDAKARQAAPRAKSYTLSDSGGLLLFVVPSGAKHWHFRFSWKGRRARISLGNHPLIGLRQVRLLRDEARVQLAQGGDPRAGRAQVHIQVSVLDGFAQRHGLAVKLYLDKDILPKPGQLALADIERLLRPACAQTVAMAWKSRITGHDVSVLS